MMLYMIQTILGLVALALIVTIPGYCLTLAFFPRKSELEELERFAFSFVFSITFFPLLVLVENQVLKIPIDSVSALVSVLIIVAFGLLVWRYRIRKLKKDEAVQIWFPKMG